MPGPLNPRISALAGLSRHCHAVRMPRLSALLIAGLLICPGLRAAAPDPAVSRAISDVIAAQVAAWNAGSHEGFMKGYFKSDDILFLSGDKITRGWATVLARYQKSYPDEAAMGTLTIGDLEFNALAPDTVLVVGHWKVDSKKHKSNEGVTTLIFRQTPDGWRIIHDHTS